MGTWSKSKMANIKTPHGTIRINRTSKYRAVDYELEVSFIGADTEDGYVNTAKRDLNLLIDGSVDSRSDVTADVIQEAMTAFFDQFGDRYNIQELRNVDVVESQVIRKRPYEDVYGDEA